MNPELEDIKILFIERLSGRADEIAEAIAETRVSLERGLNPDEALLKASYVAHNIAGTAGSFGYKQLTDNARQFEQQIRALTTATSEGTDKNYALLFDYHDNLQQQILDVLAE